MQIFLTCCHQIYSVKNCHNLCVKFLIDGMKMWYIYLGWCVMERKNKSGRQEILFYTMFIKLGMCGHHMGKNSSRKSHRRTQSKGER